MNNIEENRNFSTLNECKVCDRKFKNLNGLSNHLSRKHNISIFNYISEHIIGYWPLCKCGCNEKVKWYQCEFEDWLSGHVSRTDKNAWHRNIGKEPVNKTKLTDDNKQFIINEFVNNHKQIHIIGNCFNVSKNVISRFLIKKLGKDEYFRMSSLNDSWRRVNIKETNDKIRVAAALGGNAFSKLYNTKIEKIMKSLLKDVGLRDKFTFQFKLKDYETNNVFCFDFGDKNKKVIIECDGDYWHSNPKFYEKLNETQLYNKNRDKLKNETAAKSGYKMYRFWECDIINNVNEVKKQLQDIKMNIYNLED